MKVRYRTARGVKERLFDIVAQSSRRATFWERLETGKRTLPRSVRVSSLAFSGNTLTDLLTWTLKQKNSRSALGVAAAAAVEMLGTAVMHETDAAMSYVNDLHFGSDSE